MGTKQVIKGRGKITCKGLQSLQYCNNIVSFQGVFFLFCFMSDAVCVSCIDFESCFMRQLLSNLSWVKISESCLADRLILPLRVPAEDSEGFHLSKQAKVRKMVCFLCCCLSIFHVNIFEFTLEKNKFSLLSFKTAKTSNYQKSLLCNTNQRK